MTVLADIRLTEKQESFCSKIAAGRSKSQAYRESYDARGMSEQSIWCEAHRLSVHPKVAPRLAEIQSECSERLVSSAIADREEVLVAVTDILRSDDSSDNAKLKRARGLRQIDVDDHLLCLIARHTEVVEAHRDTLRAEWNHEG